MSHSFIALSCVGFLATAPHVAAAETGPLADSATPPAAAVRPQDSTGERDVIVTASAPPVPRSWKAKGDRIAARHAADDHRGQ